LPPWCCFPYPGQCKPSSGIHHISRQLPRSNMRCYQDNYLIVWLAAKAVYDSSHQYIREQRNHKALVYHNHLHAMQHLVLRFETLLLNRWRFRRLHPSGSRSFNSSWTTVRGTWCPFIFSACQTYLYPPKHSGPSNISLISFVTVSILYSAFLRLIP
jgi:hypothetical protein